MDITKVVIGRTPVQSAITSALNVVSMGKVGENQEKQGYDKLFHLFLELTMDTHYPIRLEKNEVITMTEAHPDKPATEKDDNVAINKPITLNELLANTKHRMGDKFFKYDSANNNCQDFVLAVLQSNNLASNENISFIKQNTKALFENAKGTRGIAKQITNLGQRVNILTSGGSIESDYIIQSVIFPKSYEVKNARKWLKANGYKSPKVDIETNTLRFRQISPTVVKRKGYTEYKNKEIGDGIILVIVYKEKISGNSIMPRFKKGSKEAIEWGQKMRAMRGKKKGGSVEGEPIDVVGGGLYAGKGLYAGAGLYAGRGVEDSDSDKSESDDEIDTPTVVHIHHHIHHQGEEGKGFLKKVAKSTASKLIHKGIPLASSALGALAGSMTGSPVGTFVGRQAGEALGSQLAKVVGKKTGLGLKKGSKEAKEWGAKMKRAREAKK